MTATRQDLENVAAKITVIGVWLTALMFTAIALLTSSIVDTLLLWTVAAFLIICAQAIETNGYSRAFMQLLPMSGLDKPPLDERQYSDGEPVWGDN